MPCPAVSCLPHGEFLAVNQNFEMPTGMPSLPEGTFLSEDSVDADDAWTERLLIPRTRPRPVARTPLTFWSRRAVTLIPVTPVRAGVVGSSSPFSLLNLPQMMSSLVRIVIATPPALLSWLNEFTLAATRDCSESVR